MTNDPNNPGGSMNLPRFVAIVSAIVSSTAGFFVLSRWRLIGTFTGAAVVPVVYTLVSHFSNSGLDRLERWFRGRRPCADNVDGCQEPDTLTKSAQSILPGEARPASGESTAGKTPRSTPESEAAKVPPRKWGRYGVQWSLAVFAFLAFAVSLYSIVQASPGEKTIVRERIIEKTVTVTTVEYIYSSASAPRVDAQAPTGQSQGETGTPTSGQTATTDQAGEDPGLSSTTTTTAADGGGGGSSSTSSSTSSTTTLP